MYYLRLAKNNSTYLYEIITYKSYKLLKCMINLLAFYTIITRALIVLYLFNTIYNLKLP